MVEGKHQYLMAYDIGIQIMKNHIKTTKIRTIFNILEMEEKGLFKFQDSRLHFSDPVFIEPSVEDLGLGYLGRTEELQE